jgi:hypothetical protein
VSEWPVVRKKERQTENTSGSSGSSGGSSSSFSSLTHSLAHSHPRWQSIYPNDTDTVMTLLLLLHSPALHLHLHLTTRPCPMSDPSFSLFSPGSCKNLHPRQISLRRTDGTDGTEGGSEHTHSTLDTRHSTLLTHDRHHTTTPEHPSIIGILNDQRQYQHQHQHQAPAYLIPDERPPIHVKSPHICSPTSTVHGPRSTIHSLPRS